MDFATERERTRPDYLVYQPGSLDGSTHDTGNEQFLLGRRLEAELPSALHAPPRT